ncbi:hypothetical protein ACJ73_04860 [Blastomyces percursus]|uniref:Uncharacterized protein n=1 Tax=Blastomyces percursus TaxID=1658174 RepID=A0A1J9Q516_9EURO|nr:hypothetical protein ACJ73_04860 [Blastomyces percursus]
MATTPPPRAIRTPAAPRHGARFDSHEPYSTRYSARLANRKASGGSSALFTPNSPRSPNDTDLLTGLRRYPSEEDSFSPPQSTQAFPTRRSDSKTKNSQPPVDTHSFFNNTRGRDDLASHSSLGVSLNMDSEHTTLTANMLPTPAKTPRKKTVRDPCAVSRTLFKGNNQSREIGMPVPQRQRSRKFKGFSLESFNAELENEGNDEIAIFTDSRDRIPEVHEASDNPFISRPNDSSHGNHETQRDEKVQEALRRDDGMLYVFRGKKIFRKFNSDTEEDDETDLGLLASQADPLEEPSLPRARPLTRSSIKPRLLFPNASRRGEARGSRFSGTDNTIDAEVGCEVDEPNQGESNSDPPSTGCEDIPATPPSRSGISTPTAPLTYGRSLRSHKKEAQDGLESPSKPPNRTSIRMSPFDRWTRTKSQASPTTMRKRVGTLSSDSVEPVLKKARSK